MDGYSSAWLSEWIYFYFIDRFIEMATQEGRSTTPVKEKRLHRPTTTGTLSEDFMGSRASMKG